MDFRVADGEKLVEEAELVHQFERRRVNSVAAEIAEEVDVLLKDRDVDSGAREEEAKHHSGGPTADDATSGLLDRDIGRCHGAMRVARCFRGVKGRLSC